jgi:phage terminase large subunit-like protein
VFLDDIVVPANAYTNEGRSKVQALYSQLASVETTGARETCVGTRYHPLDIYKDMMEMHEPDFDEAGEIIGKRSVYSISVERVETSGHFLWPKEYRASDGKPFGFDAKELGRKKAKYIDQTQFFAQYYQEPNDPESHRLSYERFQYYPKERLRVLPGGVQYNGEFLNVYASIDFAYSTSKKADFSAIVVIGVGSNGHVYLLDIDRFKTNNIDGYYQHVLDMHAKWHFKKLRAEVTAAQVIIVRDLKDRASQEGLPLVIEDNRPTRHDGSKEERIAAVLEPRYMNGTMWHFRGGYTPMLEEELVLARPPHDDIKDALAAAVEFSRPPLKRQLTDTVPQRTFHKRFGGVTA